VKQADIALGKMEQVESRNASCTIRKKYSIVKIKVLF
jgi:hypothetical protein